MRYLITVIMALMIGVGCWAQRMSVISMERNIENMSYSMERKDLNGKVCALVKVEIPVEGCKFEGNVIDAIFDVSEYMVYLIDGTKHLRIKCPGVPPLQIQFSDYGVDHLVSRGIYTLCIDGYNAQIPPSATQMPAAPGGMQSPMVTKTMYPLKFVVINEYAYTPAYGLSLKRIPFVLPNLRVIRNLKGQDSDACMTKTTPKAGSYIIETEGALGDKFDIMADGYKTVSVNFEDINRREYELTLSPKTYNVKFHLLEEGGTEDEPLIGCVLYVYKKGKNYYEPTTLYDNHENGDRRPYDKAYVTDIDGFAEIKGLTVLDEVEFSYIGYRNKRWSAKDITEILDKNEGSPTEIKLECLADKTWPTKIGIGGLNDVKGQFQVTNQRTGISKIITVTSTKADNNSVDMEVMLGDVITISHKGYRTIEAKFVKQIPEEIRLMPKKGKTTDIDKVEY